MKHNCSLQLQKRWGWRGQDKRHKQQQATFQLDTKYSIDSKILTVSVHLRQRLSLQSCPCRKFDIKLYGKEPSFWITIYHNTSDDVGQDLSPTCFERSTRQISLSALQNSRAGGDAEVKMKKPMIRIKMRSLTNYYHKWKRLDLVKINSLPIEIGLDSEKQRQELNHHPHLPCLPWLNFSPSYLTTPPPPPEQHRGMGNGGLRSVHNSSSLSLLSPHTFPVIQCVALLWAAVFQDKPAPVWALHRLQFLQGISTGSSIDTLIRVSYTFMIISSLNLRFCVEIKLMGQVHLLCCQAHNY